MVSFARVLSFLLAQIIKTPNRLSFQGPGHTSPLQQHRTYLFRQTACILSPSFLFLP